MTRQITLTPHGRHSPAYTGQVADAFAETVRVLIYATSAAQAEDGLPYPGTVSTLLGSLAEGAGQLEQLLQQVGRRLTDLAHQGRLEVREGEFTGRPVPGLERALKYARPGDTFVITRLSRAVRSLRHLLELAGTLSERGTDPVVLKQGIDTTSGSTTANEQTA